MTFRKGFMQKNFFKGWKRSYEENWKKIEIIQFGEEEKVQFYLFSGFLGMVFIRVCWIVVVVYIEGSIRKNKFKFQFEDLVWMYRVVFLGF